MSLSWRMIESLDSTSSIRFAGSEYPAVALVEDQHAIGVLVAPLSIPRHLWALAQDRFWMVIFPLDSGYLHVLVEDITPLGPPPWDEKRLHALGIVLSTPADVVEVTELLRAQAAQRKADTFRGGFVNVHTHTEFCLDSSTRVLMADLSWRQIGQVALGEEMVGFDENLRLPDERKRGRGSSKMKRSVVTGVSRVLRECYRIKLANGAEIIASKEHPWVATGIVGRGCQVAPISSEPMRHGGRNWRPGSDGKSFKYCEDGCSRSTNTRRWLNTDMLMPGKSRLVLWGEPWGPLPVHQERTAGWLAGIADGEGWLNYTSIGLSQNTGLVFDEIGQALDDLGFGYTIRAVTSSKKREIGAKQCWAYHLEGYSSTARFLDWCKPVRFVPRSDEIWVGRSAGGRYNRSVLVTELEYLGMRETVALQTSTSTFVAEGFLTHNSSLDGLTTIDELIGQCQKYYQPGVVVTDHGVCAAHPMLLKKAAAADLTPVAGIEAYFVPDRSVRVDQYDYFHLLLWATNDVGLRNLWASSTEAYRSGFYGKPRMDFDILSQNTEGMIASTACLRGPFSKLLLQGKLDAANALMGRFMEIFPDRLYVELHCNQIPDQILLNQYLVDFAKMHSLPLIAAVDSHYPCASDQETHRLWIKSQTFSSSTAGSDDSGLFSNHQDYHLMTRSEVRSALSYLPPQAVEEAMDNTVALVKRVKPYSVVKAATPIFSVEKGRSYAVKRLVDICLANWTRKISNRPHTKPESEYLKRFEYEMEILRKKDFCDYFCIVADYVRWAKDQHILVGPGRGSGSASLVAYLSDITEVDPVEYDLPFARFITIDRSDPPDFDVDFPSSKRGAIQEYLTSRWGADYVIRVGTHGRIKNKDAFKVAYRVLKDEMEINFVDVEAIAKIIDEEERGTAGLGKSWDDLHISAEEAFAPYKERYPRLFEVAASLVGRLKSYGKHAAGLVISTGEPLTGRLPLRKSDDAQMIAEFDFPSLEALGLLKFDILTVTCLDMLQMCVDLIRERRGITINFYDWVEEFRDPQVWESLCEGDTLGVFQFHTSAMTKAVRRFQPTEIRHLADITSLQRPGPMRSGMTETYFRRRLGAEQVSYPHPKLEKMLAPTEGVVIYQEQVMNICKELAGFDDVNANKVRSILGKKKLSETNAKGEEFVRECVAHGVDAAIAAPLWDQMAEFAKYSFSVCLTGDTKVSISASNHHTSYGVVEEMYRKLHTPMHPATRGRTKAGDEFQGPCVVCGATQSIVWVRGYCNPCYQWRRKFLDPKRGLKGLSCYQDGRIRPSRIQDVVYSGEQTVYRIVLESGNEISSTADHRHMSFDGYVKTSELDIGDVLMVDAGYDPPSFEERKRTGYLTNLEIPQRKKGKVSGAFGGDNWSYVDGGFSRWQKWREETPRVCQECGKTPSEASIQCAHLDGNHQNNVVDNFAWMCQSCHFKFDYKYNGCKGRYHKGHLTTFSPIVLIEELGVRPTYDVVMADEPHNFVANGIVTHNCHAIPYSMIGYYCVTGFTKVFDWDTQQYVRISKLFKESGAGGGRRIACYDETTGKTIPGTIKTVVRTTGAKNLDLKMAYVVKVGMRQVECSIDHPFLTPQGWKRLEELSPGDLVAYEKPTHKFSDETRDKIRQSVTSNWAQMSSEEKSGRLEPLLSAWTFESRSIDVKRQWAEMESEARKARVAKLMESARSKGLPNWSYRRTGVHSVCGHYFASRNEREVCNWFNRHGLDHESQIWVNRKFADFRCQGVFIEFDGIGREDSYFEEKFGDEPFVVLKDRRYLDRDLGFLLDAGNVLMGEEVVFHPIDSITATRPKVMYDIVMEDEPHNFLANGIVVHNCGWLRVHYPEEFLTACLSTEDMDNVPHFVTEAKRMGYGVFPPDINLSGKDFAPEEMAVRYGLLSIKGIGEKAVDAIVEAQPFSSYEDFRERMKGTPCNVGTIKVLAAVGALDSLYPNRRELELRITGEADGTSDTCRFKDESLDNHGLPCQFNWESEPVTFTKTGKEQKRKGPPKRCTKGCRNYSPLGFTSSNIEPYTAPEIRDKEMEYLGVWLSSTPFDRIPEDLWGSELVSGSALDRAPNGVYQTVGLLKSVRPKKDSLDNPMGFLTILAKDSLLDAVMFSSAWTKYHRQMRIDRMMLMKVVKTDRGLQVKELTRLND